MGFFKKFLGDAADELKKNLDESRNEFMKSFGDVKQSALRQRQDFDSDDDEDDDEPKIKIGDEQNGVLTLFEGITEMDDESLEGYEHLRKIVFPASLEHLDSHVICDQEELEEVDFSKVKKLKAIPDDFISGKHKIRRFVIPDGVTTVGDRFLGEAEADTEVFVPASVKSWGYITGKFKAHVVYLYAANINIEDMEFDVDTFYVPSQSYGQYALKLKKCDSSSRLREMPEEFIGFYSKGDATAPAAQPAPSSVLSDVPTIPVYSPKTEGKKQQGVFSDRLESIIEAALQDGVLTQKEREIILRRAEKEGEDIDEVEIYIDSLLQKRQKELNNSAVKKQAKTSSMDELKKLIDAAMTDGVLTDKERQVILKKAEEMGLDRDEIDLYLDAQVQKIDQANDAAVRKQKGKTCPYCQGDVPLLATKCPHCEKIITAQATEELQEIFDNLEEALINMKDGQQFSRNKATVERYARKARMYYGENPKVQRLLEEVDAEIKQAEKIAKDAERKAAMANAAKSASRWRKFYLLLFLFIAILAIIIMYFLPMYQGEAYIIMIGGPIALVFLVILGKVARWASEGDNNHNNKEGVQNMPPSPPRN